MSSPPSVVDAARQLAGSGQADQAVAMLEAAGDRGDSAALFQLAAWRLIGQPVPRDLPRARALLRRAVAIGHVDAALMEVALTANGSGGVPDWPRAVALLKAAAEHDPVAQEQRRLLDEMNLDDCGAPQKVLAPEPLTGDAIQRFAAFASAAECAHIAGAGADLLAPAVVVDPQTGRQVAHPVRTSHEAVIGPMRESLVVQAINRRIALCSHTAVEQGEALTLLRYQPAQQYRLHHDSITGTGNQRIATALLYLNDGYTGGETHFPEFELTIVPRAGDLVVFRNLTADGRPDPRMRHAGLPIIRGVKWLATRWIRSRPFSPWTGPEAA